jgi:hypothetical protein
MTNMDVRVFHDKAPNGGFFVGKLRHLDSQKFAITFQNIDEYQAYATRLFQQKKIKNGII